MKVGIVVPYSWSYWGAVIEHVELKVAALRGVTVKLVLPLKSDVWLVQQAARWVEEYRKFWEGSLDRLAEFLEKQNQPLDRRKTK